MADVLIDGQSPRAPDAGVEIQNPATLKPVGLVPLCRDAGLDSATARARAEATRLARRAPDERLAALRTGSGAVLGAAETLAALLTAETGKPIWESRDCVAAVAEYCALADSAAGTGGSGGLVVGTVISADFPLLDLVRQLRVLLGAGHAVVCLAPPRAPLAIRAFLELLTELPEGAVSVVTGDEVTRALFFKAPGIDAWLDSDGQTAGRPDAAVAVLARRGPARVLAVAADADVGLAAATIAAARLYNGGQLVVPRLRLYAERPVAAALSDALHTCIAFLEVGDPARPGTDLGPLHSADAANRIEAQVGQLLKRRVTLKVGGRRFRPWGLPGHFFQPTVLADVSADDPEAVGDIRGPVLVLSPVDDLGAALAAEAGRWRTVEAAVISEDPERAMANLTGTARALATARPSAFSRLLARAGYASLYAPAGEGVFVAAADRPDDDSFPYAERPRHSPS